MKISDLWLQKDQTLRDPTNTTTLCEVENTLVVCSVTASLNTLQWFFTWVLCQYNVIKSFLITNYSKHERRKILE